MNDRVRIYELARQMNLPNQDLVVTLRELGYEVKSHSSTIDGSVVGLLIAALGKKKGGDKVSAVPAPSAPAPAKAAKASKATIAPPPEPVVVKPRVLSRRKPTPPPGEVVAEPIAEPLAPAVEAPAAQAPVAAPEPVAPSPLPPPGTIISRPPTSEPRVAPVPEAPVAPVAPVAPAADETSTETQKPDGGKKDGKKSDKKHHRDDDDDNENSKFVVGSQKAAPSQPVRVAAPSIRATPPRPPKSHRQGGADRHAKKEEKAKPAAAILEVPKIITLTQPLTVKELAERMLVSETEVIKRLFMKGFMRTVNQMVELELARDLAIEMEYEVLTEEKPAEKAEEVALTDEEKAALVTRPPVVTIMGHVDHGKTSLLDAIRQTKFQITAGEAGGITQHIGAYHVEVPAEDGTIKQIVFLDTPGHEAFTAMRARGAKATDIAILVVAADDGVMPQTIEAIDHAKAAGVPIIVAVNKVDKAEADPDRVLSQLMEHELVAEKYGGDTVTVEVSAKKRVGLDQLLEMILLVADVLELKANPDGPAQGLIVEAELSRGRGAVATALVQNGTLHEGDYIVAGTCQGRVRALFDDRGERVKAAGPSMPVEVLGLDEVPAAGDRFEVADDIQAGKAIAEERRLVETDKFRHRVTLESLHDLLEQGEVKELNVIIKADVQGTAEAIAESVKRLSNKEVAVRVLRTASGDISENDVNLAASSEAIIIGFNVQPDANANRVKESAGVDVRTYSIIYQITDDLIAAIEGLIQPLRTEVKIGSAEVRQIFKFGKNLMIAGCMVNSGKIQRGCIARIERDGQTIYDGKLDTLKRFKDDAKEVASGFECGMSFANFTDIKEGDIIHAFIIQETKREIPR